MNNKIILIVIIIIICSINIIAISNDNLISCYDFQETSGTIVIDYAGYLNGTSSSMTLGNTGISGYGYDFINSEANIILATTGDYNFLKNESEDYTIAAWLYPTRIAGTHENIFHIYESSNSYITTANVGGDILRSEFKYGTNILYADGISITLNSWHSAVWIFNDANLLIYLDNSLIENTTNTNISHIFPNHEIQLGIEKTSASNWDWDGMMDTVTFFNRAWNVDEVSSYHNSGSGVNCSEFVGINLEIEFYTFNLTNNSNISSSTIPYTLNFEYNITANIEDIITCKLYEDSILVNTSIINATEQSYRNISKTFTSQVNYTSFNYELICNDSSINATDTNKTINVLIDETQPEIYFYYPLDSNISATKEMLSLNVSFEDDNLYNATITVYFPNESIYYTNNSGIINTTTFNFTEELNLSGESDGSWIVQAKGCDGHTKQLIDDYAISKDLVNKKLTYNNEVSITIINEDITDLNTIRYDDRYSFEFLLNSKSMLPSNVKFQLYSTEPLTYLKDSIYKGHFITGKYWVDFELENYTEEPYLIERIDDNNYYITITTTKKELIFKSIGELNCDEENVTFTKDSTPPNCTFSVQSPIDIEANSTGDFSVDFNCIDARDINNSKVIFIHTVNDTDCGCLNFSWKYPSNTKAGGYLNQQRGFARNESQWYEELFDNIWEYSVRNYSSIIGSTYTFTYHIHDIFKTFYPLDKTILESNVSQYVEVGGNDIVLTIIEYQYSLTNSSYSYHFYATGTSPSPLAVYYCNSSFFDDNLSYDNSPNCGFMASFAYDDEYEHTVSNVSYHVIEGSIDILGQIQGIRVTPVAHILYQSNAGVGNKWKIYYNDDTSLIGNVSMNSSNTLFTSTDKGEALISHNGTGINPFATIYSDFDTVLYKVYSCDTLDNCGYSEIISDTIGNVPVAPEKPILLSIDGDTSFTGTYSDEFIIDGILGVDFNPEDNVTGNLTIINGIYEYLIEDNLHNGGNVINVTWNSTAVDDGNYYLKLTNCDDGGLCSFINSQVFTINNEIIVVDDTLYSTGRVLFLIVIVMLIILFAILSEFTNASFLRAITFILLVAFNIAVSAYSIFFSNIFILICVLYFLYTIMKAMIDD